ncbi:OmpA family protein [Halomonas binhaiensis]|uniref:Outer membrane protein assembly factor BamE n=1 Tax=Halomonas binhaiensis TaxID=2562282 RepID=A0A5C1NI72_9GAMM|nr:OmpA family protein [Halomonas binhaiensis]QEM82461.1 outer membrane protein assembly factor BamE [Halomonas binhaiensis]
MTDKRNFRPWTIRLLAPLATALALAGCSTAATNGDAIKAGNGFPAPDSAWVKGGTFVDPDSVLRIAEGMNKDQVRYLLGNPQFSEGMFGVKEWNYVFNFYTDIGREYLSCQYQVQFDRDMSVETTRWRDSQCAELLIPVEVESVEDSADRVALNGDLLFDLDSAALGLEGKRALDRMAVILQQEYTDPAVNVLGYTDPLGDAFYNERLSQQRADVVKEYLMARGLESSQIVALGLGEDHPLARCHELNSRSALQQCFQPNRRVEIVIAKAD